MKNRETRLWLLAGAFLLAAGVLFIAGPNHKTEEKASRKTEAHAAKA